MKQTAGKSRLIGIVGMAVVLCGLVLGCERGPARTDGGRSSAAMGVTGGPQPVREANGAGGASSTQESNMSVSSSEQGRPAGAAVELEKATFGAGCFWQVEEVFRKIPGVAATSVGYSGGRTSNPTYREVCTDLTGHAEVMQIEFDPKVVSYNQLLDQFWKVHNPTTLNRQGPDVGSQYRSVIFYHSEAQKKMAEDSKAKLAASGRWKKPIVTEISPASTYYAAEDYHQRYLQKRGIDACHIVEDE